MFISEKRWKTLRQLKQSKILHMGFTGGSVVKNLPDKCNRFRRHGFSSLVGRIPWRRKWQLTPVFLPGKSHGWRSLVGYTPWSRKESDTTEQLTHTHTHTFKPTYFIFINNSGTMGKCAQSIPIIFIILRKFIYSIGWAKKSDKDFKKNHTRLALRSVVFHSEVGIPFL